MNNKAFPAQPGVYLFKDKNKKVIYVGKAKSLKDRVSSYFKQPIDSPKTEALIATYKTLNYIVTPTELEALLLERKLIEKYKPHFNIALKDDKQYPYIKLTTNEEWPMLVVVRKKEDDGAEYFGPYDATSVRETLRLLKKSFPLRSCKESPLKMRKQPCLEYHIKRCSGPCINATTKEEYLALCNAISSLLKGDLTSTIAFLNEEMKAASESQNYERAAKIRNRIWSLSKIMQKRPDWMPKKKEIKGETGL